MVDIVRADQHQRALATVFGEICDFHLRSADVEALLQEPWRDWLQRRGIARSMLAGKLRALADQLGGHKSGGCKERRLAIERVSITSK